MIPSKRETIQTGFKQQVQSHTHTQNRWRHTQHWRQGQASESQPTAFDITCQRIWLSHGHTYKCVMPCIWTGSASALPSIIWTGSASLVDHGTHVRPSTLIFNNTCPNSTFWVHTLNTLKNNALPQELSNYKAKWLSRRTKRSCFRRAFAHAWFSPSADSERCWPVLSFGNPIALQ